jgi:hypothetical protein
MKPPKTAKVEYRISFRNLDDVCLDCCDFLNHRCVECEDCPVSRLKKRIKPKDLK